VNIKIGGIQDNSTIDYQGKVCSVLYLWGCPFRCPWCHNPELVTGNEYKEESIEKIVEKIKENYLISAVSITGGEPLMQEYVIELLRLLRENTKLAIKIDTNCYFPEILEKALPFLDRIATDIKAPYDKYGKAIGIEKTKHIIEKIKKSHELLRKWNKPIDARITIVPGINDSAEDIKEVTKVANHIGAETLTLQQFRSGKTLDDSFANLDSPSHEDMKKLASEAKKIAKNMGVFIVTSENGFEEIKI
jgi:pyruvate formate lyase activating enzyme